MVAVVAPASDRLLVGQGQAASWAAEAGIDTISLKSISVPHGIQLADWQANLSLLFVLKLFVSP